MVKKMARQFRDDMFNDHIQVAQLFTSIHTCFNHYFELALLLGKLACYHLRDVPTLLQSVTGVTDDSQGVHAASIFATVLLKLFDTMVDAVFLGDSEISV